MSELLEMIPCPFCGGGAKVLKSWLMGALYTPTCDGPNECPGQNMEQDEQGGFAADYATELEAIVAWNTRDAHAALERDRSHVAAALQAFSDAFARRTWLLEGRGPYAWDDPRYREEFVAAYTELGAALEPLKSIARDWTNCPKTQEEVRAARAGGKSPANPYKALELIRARDRAEDDAYAELSSRDREVRNNVLSKLRNKWIVRDLTEDDFIEKDAGQ